MDDCAENSLARLARGEVAALVTLLAVEGSTPREAGAWMLVGPHDQSGSIGGGNLERIAADQARRMLAAPDGPGWAVQDYPLGPLLAQCCGGRVRLLIEGLGAGDREWLAEARRMAAEDRPFRRRLHLGEHGRSCAVAADGGATGDAITVNGRPVGARGERPAAGDEIGLGYAPLRPRLALFGAGHVGRALATALAPLPFRLAWYDSRPEAAAPSLVIAGPDDLVRVAGEAREHVLVMTHDHGLDYALVAAALRGATPHVGLIGSRTKKARFAARLRAEGLDEAALGRLVCPIGVAGLTGKAPEIIAVSVAADLLIRRQAVSAAPAREAALAGL